MVPLLDAGTGWKGFGLRGEDCGRLFMRGEQRVEVALFEPDSYRLGAEIIQGAGALPALDSLLAGGDKRARWRAPFEVR